MNWSLTKFLGRRLPWARQCPPGDKAPTTISRQFVVPDESVDGWQKHPGNPVLGGDLGTCFDVSVIPTERQLMMWFSWRPKKSIALVTGDDGIHWSQPEIVLGPDGTTGWEDDINRPSALLHRGDYYLWYTGQNAMASAIGLARSSDGKVWHRVSRRPILSASEPWEKKSLMCPCVLWDNSQSVFKMWFSAGDQHEPDAIGYATSRDGIHWDKHSANPVLRPLRDSAWEQHKVAGPHVIRSDDGYCMFYIGFHDEQTAMIGAAWSADGFTGWKRHPRNPIIRPGAALSAWDYSAAYKPAVCHWNKRWMLWYNGRNGSIEQIGVAMRESDSILRFAL